MESTSDSKSFQLLPLSRKLALVGAFLWLIALLFLFVASGRFGLSGAFVVSALLLLIAWLRPVIDLPLIVPGFLYGYLFWRLFVIGIVVGDFQGRYHEGGLSLVISALSVGVFGILTFAVFGKPRLGSTE